MSNPFPARFDSHCNSCGDEIFEGEDTYAVEGQFVCRNCAELNGNVCEDCGGYKSEEYDQCYDCSKFMNDDNNKNYNEERSNE